MGLKSFKGNYDCNSVMMLKVTEGCINEQDVIYINQHIDVNGSLQRHEQ
jgi:hypothetical protein